MRKHTKRVLQNVPIDWLKGIKVEEEKTKLKEQLLRNKDLFGRLHKILQAKHQSFNVNAGDLDKPNFKDRLIWTNGYQQALEEVMDLLVLEGDNIKVSDPGTKN